MPKIDPCRWNSGSISKVNFTSEIRQRSDCGLTHDEVSKLLPYMQIKTGASLHNDKKYYLIDKIPNIEIDFKTLLLFVKNFMFERFEVIWYPSGKVFLGENTCSLNGSKCFIKPELLLKSMGVDGRERVNFVKMKEKIIVSIRMFFELEFKWYMTFFSEDFEHPSRDIRDIIEVKHEVFKPKPSFSVIYDWAILLLSMREKDGCEWWNDMIKHTIEHRRLLKNFVKYTPHDSSRTCIKRCLVRRDTGKVVESIEDLDNMVDDDYVPNY